MDAKTITGMKPEVRKEWIAILVQGLCSAIALYFIVRLIASDVAAYKVTSPF